MTRRTRPTTSVLGIGLALVTLVTLVALLSAGRGGWAQPLRGEVNDPLGKELDSLMQRLAAYGFSGSVLVARKGHVVLDMGYGMADEKKKIPYTAETIFDVASISKQFTAAAVLKLEMLGQLHVEDTLKKYFPNAPEDKSGITLHQLLTHTSGLKDSFGPEYEPLGREEFVKRVLDSKLLVRPGKRYRYSNAGYGVLAAIVEKVAHQPLGVFLREQLLEPAGMHHSGYSLPGLDHPVIAHGYGPDGDWGTPLDHPWAPDGPYWNLRGNGGVMSTTGDLFRWHVALSGNTVLSAPERTKMTTGYISEGRASSSRYGYGWSVTTSPTGTKLVSHVGGNGIFEADVRRYLTDDAVIVVSSNRADFSGLAVSPHLEARLYRQRDPEPPATAPALPSGAAACAGDYGLPNGEFLHVAADARRLVLSPQGPQGFSALLGTMSAESRESATDHRERVQAALTAALAHDEKPFAALVGLEVPEASQLLHSGLDPVVGELGRWLSFEVLGDAVLGGHPYTFARFHFAKGIRYAEILWEDTVESIHYSTVGPEIPFLPLADAGKGKWDFASYEVRDGITLLLTCQPSSQGTVLTTLAPSGRVRLSSRPH
jgi:CubicO group peptidase (beta-lactamase class C family)